MVRNVCTRTLTAEQGSHATHLTSQSKSLQFGEYLFTWILEKGCNGGHKILTTANL